MCVVRISMRPGRSPEQIAILSKAIDDALVEGYKMERNDTFQIFEEIEDHKFIYDRHYKVDNPRSDDFLLFSIVGGPQTDEVKRAFYKRLVELLGERAGMRGEDVFVGMQDAAGVNWSFGMGRSLL